MFGLGRLSHHNIETALLTRVLSVLLVIVVVEVVVVVVVAAARLTLSSEHIVDFVRLTDIDNIYTRSVEAKTNFARLGTCCPRLCART